MANPTVATAKVKIGPDFAGFNQAFGVEMKKHFGNFASRQLAATGQDLTQAISMPILNFFKDGLKVASDFYTTIGELSGIMAETTNQTYKEFSETTVTFMKDGKVATDTFVKGLREIARESKFSVNEMGQASTSLARTGIRSQQEMLDILQTSQKVAAATREELVPTTEAMRTLSQVFNTGSGLLEMKHIGDIMTTVMSTANVDLATFMEGMKRAGPVANSLGLGIEETASSVAVLANVGFKGSTASTALKNAMIRLRSDTPAVTEILDKYNIVTEKADGTSRGLADVLTQMNEKGLTTSEMFKVFGQIAGPAMAALVQEKNIKGIKELTKSMENMQGVTDRLYDRLKETPEFKMEAVASNFEELKLTVVDGVFPAFASGLDTVNDGITSFVSMFQDLPQPVQQFAVAAGLAVASAGPLMIVFGKLGQSAGIIGPAIRNLIPSITKASAALGYKLASGLLTAADAMTPLISSFSQASLEITRTTQATVTAPGRMANALRGVQTGLAKSANFLSAFLSSGPALAGIAAAVGLIGYAWYKSNQNQRKSLELQKQFTEVMFTNLSKNEEQRKTLSEEFYTLIKDEDNALGEILGSGNYKTGLEKMGITYNNLADSLSEGGYQATILLSKLGELTALETDSFMEKFGNNFRFTSNDSMDSITRYYEMAKDFNTEIINNAGAFGDELRANKKLLTETARKNPNRDNMELRVEDMKFSEKIKNDKKLLQFELERRANRDEKLLEYDEKTGVATYETWKVSQAWLVQEQLKFIKNNNQVFIEGIGFMTDLATASSDTIKNSTIADIHVQIAANEELSKAMDDVRKNQADLGIGTNASGLEELGSWDTSSSAAVRAINAVIASGQDLGEKIPAIAQTTGTNLDTVFSLATAKMNQFKASIDRVRQTIPTLSSVMGSFTKEDPPSLGKAMERLTNKFKAQAEIQSKLKDLISINGGEFLLLYQELSKMSPEEQLSIGLNELDLSEEGMMARLREMQASLKTEMENFGAAATSNITAGAENELGKGVTFTDPIQEAFNKLSKELEDDSIVPTISPRIDPSFIARWNGILTSIQNAESIGFYTSYLPDTKRAAGGPVWPGLRSSVNELGREGFVNSKGEFSMLPNTSSMKFNEYGTVIPAHMIGNSRGGVNINNNINVNGVSMQEIVEYQTALEQSQMRRMGGGL